MKKFNLSVEEEKLAKKIVGEKERELRNSDQVILNSKKLGKYAVVDLVLEVVDHVDLRFRVSMYDRMGLDEDIELAYEEYFDFSEAELERAKEYYQKSIEEVLFDLEDMEQKL